MAKYYTYMIGIEPSDWDFNDTKACKKYNILNKGYYKLGDQEGMVLVGELDDLENIMELYFGLEINDDYLCEVGDFDAEDGRWITGGWYESKKSTHKSLKESISDNNLVFKVATKMGEVTNVRIDKEFDYLFDINTLCDIIYFVCDELDADYKFHMLPKYDHGTQIRVDFVRDVTKVGWLSFEPLIKDTFELTKQIEGMLE